MGSASVGGFRARPQRHNACAAALLMGLPAASPAMAQDAVTTSAPAGITVPPLGFAKRTLANGLEAYTARDTSTSTGAGAPGNCGSGVTHRMAPVRPPTMPSYVPGTSFAPKAQT